MLIVLELGKNFSHIYVLLIILMIHIIKIMKLIIHVLYLATWNALLAERGILCHRVVAHVACSASLSLV